MALSTELRRAMESGNEAQVLEVLAHVESFSGPLAKPGHELVLWAIARQSVDVLRAALLRGAPTRSGNPKQPPYLALATSVEVARAFIEGGADVHATWVANRRLSHTARPAHVLRYRVTNDEHPDVKRYLSAEMGWFHPDALKNDPWDAEDFWALVHRAGKKSRGDPAWLAREVVGHLRELTPGEIAGFQRRFDAIRSQLLSAELWAFFYLLDGGCSDDAFLFEVPGRVMSKGRKVTEMAIEDPDRLTPAFRAATLRYRNYSSIVCDNLGDAAHVACRMLTGRDDFVDIVGSSPPAQRSVDWDPSDMAWLRSRLPRAWEAFGASPPPAGRRRSG